MMNVKQNSTIAVITLFVMGCFAVGLVSRLSAQYPQGAFQGGVHQSNDTWSVSPPGMSDQGSNATSMSPDHWGSPSGEFSGAGAPADGYQSTAFPGGFSSPGFNSPGFSAPGSSAPGQSQQGMTAGDFAPSSTPWGATDEFPTFDAPARVNTAPVASSGPNVEIPLPPSASGGEFGGNSSGTSPGTSATSPGTSAGALPMSNPLYGGEIYRTPETSAPAASGNFSPERSPNSIFLNESPTFEDESYSATAPPINQPPHLEAPRSEATLTPQGESIFVPDASTNNSESTPGMIIEGPIVSGGEFIDGATYDQNGQIISGPPVYNNGIGYPSATGGGFQSRLVQEFSGGGYGSYSEVHGAGQFGFGQTGGNVVMGSNVVNGGPPHARADLGFRSATSSMRGGMPWDDGTKFGYEDKKKDYPPMSEILATGIYYGLLEVYYVQPHFQGNTAIATSSGVSEAFNFDNDTGFKFRAGFESEYGPGLDLNYFQFDQNSAPSTFTSDGSSTGTTSTWMIGPNQWSRLSAVNAGETLDARHSLEVQTFGASFFKELKFPISRLNGMFGMQYASIAQQLDATVSDSTGAVIERLVSTSDMRAFGPRVNFEYFRPVGHTPMNLISNFGGALMFGNRDQFIQNSATGDLSRVGADEFITMLDFGSALQYRFRTGEKRFVSAKIGYNAQVWIGGGTAVLPQDDFGFRGYTFSIGVNR